VRAAEDLQSCQIRFRDQLNPAEREQWRNAVQWSIQVADSPDVRKVLTDLRKFLEVSTEYLRKPKELTNQRDRAMAQFVASILEQHGGDSRIALWAHDWHVSKFDGDPTEDVPRMGTFLQREFADDYFPVGLSFGSGGFQSKYFPQEDEDVSRLALRAFEVNGSRADSFSYLLDYCDSSVSAHVLSSNQELPSWFAEPHFYRSIGAAYQPKLALTESYYEKVVLPKHFELVLHVKKTERARPLSPVPKFRFGAKFVNEREEEQTNASDTVPAVVVASVLPKSIAEQCGLRVDDQIVGVSEQRVRDVDEFQRTLATIDRPGSHVLEILRLAGDENAGSARQRLVLYFTVPPWITD
ncbi:MAG: erythromycin esterase family protein, partial [Planctomycetota bacterium]